MSHIKNKNVCNVNYYARFLCVFVLLVLLFASCQRDQLYMQATILQIELTRSNTEDALVCKGAVDDFTADVFVVYEKSETKYTCFFGDPYNKGVYTIDSNSGDVIFASTGVPFHIRVETEINGQKLRGVSEELVIEDASMVISIELYAGEFRIYTRTPREEDLSESVALVGGAIYELQEEQVATSAGVICAPVSSSASFSDENFTIENLQNLVGYRTDSRAFGVDDGIDGRSEAYLPFEVKLVDHDPRTEYRIRAYAVIDSVVHYGQVVTFSTMRSGPSLFTLSATDITQNSARMNAEVISAGGDVSERGFVYSRSKFFDRPHTIACGSGGGDFDAVVSDLNPCTRIFYKAYVKTSYGTYYGEIASFSTYDWLVDGRDGSEYKYVSIGSQTWMSENLRYLPQVSPVETGSEDSGRESEKHYYIYGYSGTSVSEASASSLSQAIENVPSGTNSYATFGVLYNYNAAQSACPEGWHLPSDGEWTQLEIYLQNNGFNSNGVVDCDLNRLTNNFIAKSLSSSSLWCQSDFENTVGFMPDRNNSTGMSVSPSGYRSGSSDDFYGLGKDAYFWTATGANGSEVYGRSIGFTNDGLNRSSYAKSNGISVRCVKNN